MIRATEWQNIPPKYAESLSHACTTPQDPKTLGLHNQRDAIRPGNFIGVIRIDDCVLQVNSKFPQMDCLAMFLHCADILGERMRDCLNFWPEEPPIETDHAPDFCGLVAAAFLRELNDLCAHRLRRNFRPRGGEFDWQGKREDFVGGKYSLQLFARPGGAGVLRVSIGFGRHFGKPHFARGAGAGCGLSFGRGLVSGRTGDIGALGSVVSLAFARGFGCSDARRRFLSARSRGAFSHYRRPLHVARAVLESTGFDLDGVNGRASGVVPFALNSAKLFERWVEIKLLEEYHHLQVGRGDIPADEGGVVKIRPDFWIPAEDGKSAMILDAKYKFVRESIRGILDKNAHDDIYQMVAYSRHRRFCGRSWE